MSNGRSSIEVNEVNSTHEDYNAKSTSRKQQVYPGLDLSDLYIESRRNDTAFVQATVQLNNNLPRTVIVNQLKFANVAYKERIQNVSSHV
jgi:hypothetical protein